MRIYPPDMRIGYKGRIDEPIDSYIQQLKYEMSEKFVQQIENYKGNIVTIQLINERITGKIVNIRLEQITLLDKDIEKKIEMDSVVFIQFHLN